MSSNAYSGPGDDGGTPYEAGVAVVVSVLFVLALVRLARYILGPPSDGEAQQQPAQGRGDGEPQPEVAVEVRSVEALVCAYRRGDGWREATCPVCLSDFADGETVRVLPACMHYFHAACVGEWLRRNTTCPVCRTTPPPPSPARSPVKATSMA
ncbi:hypothetical protein CFC21_061382 [Triticum aestivum]|uniref:RING-type domain-containing protein n=2 Tax=Triticum aestivum TaxID=4565 RepID=A0A3B6JIR1_WHEAT|nr:putative RING-H2 finger protein ATL69 [Aegilops tauschii subsp. strangulata]KAF7053451.1 hypothetical protein CFC21_061382 [Triticum aestivum]